MREHRLQVRRPLRCPVCDGAGKVLGFGIAASEPQVMVCPECAGLPFVPASADERRRA